MKLLASLLVLVAVALPAATAQRSDNNTNPAAPVQEIQGELQVLISEGHDPIYVVMDEFGNTTVVSLNESAIMYSGWIVRIVPTPPSPSPSPSSSPKPSPARRSPTSAHRLLLANTTNTTTYSPPQQLGVTTPQNGEPLPGAQTVPGALLGAQKPSGKDFTLGARNITSVVFLLSFCGYEPAVDPAAFRAMWVNGDQTPADAYTMQNYWANCSQGLARMTRDTQIVAEVKLPCTGNNNGRQYNFKDQCRDNELYSMMNLAEDYVRTQLGINLSGVKQRVAVLPRQLGSACPWAGLASVGCLGLKCYTWINGLGASDLTLYHHEMGHNLGLMHSSRAGSSYEYGDYTCAMGSAPSCYNAANLWKLGWAKPVTGGDLNRATLPSPGEWRSFQLPYASRALEDQLRIVPDWAPKSPDVWDPASFAEWPNYFVSARLSEGFDRVPSYWITSPGRVAIHSSNSTTGPYSYQRARLETLLGVGGVYRLPLPYGLSVRVDSLDLGSGAGVSVCRADRAKESVSDETCNDGLDNDCDGLADDQDPDCVRAGPSTSTGTAKPSPPPPAKSPSPPPPAKSPSPPPPAKSPSPPPPAKSPSPPPRAKSPSPPPPAKSPSPRSPAAKPPSPRPPSGSEPTGSTRRPRAPRPPSAPRPPRPPPRARK